MKFISDRRTFEKARALVNVYGFEAREKAASMADECENLGFERTRQAWASIGSAIDVLLDEPITGASLH